MTILKPQNRIEDYLYIILKKLNGEDINLNSLYLPKSRIEDYLYKIALNINSSQGGGTSSPSNVITDIEVRNVEEGDTPSLTFTRENNKYFVDIVFPTAGTNFSGNAIDVFYKDNAGLNANNVQDAIDKLKKYTDTEIDNLQLTGGAMDYAYVDNKVQDLIGGATQDFDTLGEISNVLENNPNIINELRKQMVSILEDSQKYTDEQIATLNNIDIEIVAVLPPVGKEDTLYFVVNAVGDSFLDLYLWDTINQDFDLVGSSTINLDGYAKLEDLPTKTSQLENDSNFAVIDDSSKSKKTTYSSSKIEELVNAISNDILPRLSISSNRLYFDGQLIHLQGDTVAQADKVTGWQQTKPNSYLGVDKDGVFGWHTLPLTLPPMSGEYGGDKVTQLFLNKVVSGTTTEIPTKVPFNIVQCFSAYGNGVQGDKTLFKFDENSEISGTAESSPNNIVVKGTSTTTDYAFDNDLCILSDEGESIFYSTDVIANPSDVLGAEILNGTLGTTLNNKSCFNDRFQFKNIKTNAVLTTNLTQMSIPTSLNTYTYRVENTNGAGINILLDNTINVSAIDVYVDTRYACEPFVVSHIGLDGITRVIGTFVGNPTSGLHSIKFTPVKGGRITLVKNGTNYAYINRLLVYGNDSSTDVLVVNQDNNIIDVANSNNVVDIQGQLTEELYKQYKTTINTDLFKSLPANIKLVKYKFKTGDLIVPKMTSNTTVVDGRTYVVTASSNYGSGSYAPYKAFDRLNRSYGDSHLCAYFDNPSWVKIDLAQPEYLGKYTYTGRNYSPSCMAHNWTIEGSNDDVNWDVIHTGNSDTNNQAGGYVYESPDLTPTKKYRYYKISTTDNTTTYSLGIGELQYFGKAGYEPVPNTIRLQLTTSQQSSTVEVIQEADLTSIANIMFMNTIIYGDLNNTKFQLSFDDKATWKDTKDGGMSWVDATDGTPILELATINKTILDGHIQSDKKLFIKVVVDNPMVDTTLESVECRYQEERPYRLMTDTTHYLDLYKSKIVITWRGTYEFVKIHFI